MEKLLPVGLCLVQLKVTIFSLIAIFFYSIISNILLLDHMAHYAVMQKEVDEIFVMGIMELLTCGVGFYSNVLVVTKHTSGG